MILKNVDMLTHARIIKMHDAISRIVLASPTSSFADIIESDRESFRGLEVVYSTNSTTSEVLGGSFKSIEEKCPILKNYFYGSAVLFYTDVIYERTLSEGTINIPLEYSFVLDSNAAERFRIFENGGNLGADEESFDSLLRFLYGGDEGGLRMNFGFFMLENLENARNLSNMRPFNTIRAIKRCRSLVYSDGRVDIRNPKFTEGREEVGREAARTIYEYQSDAKIAELAFSRLVVYASLLKLAEMSMGDKRRRRDKLRDFIEFITDSLGKFAKLEAYIAWKFLKHGEDLRFFSPIMNPRPNMISKLKGMSWDIYSMRFLETMGSESRMADFYLPFFATYDNRFRELFDFCPVQAVVIDREIGQMTTVFLDEMDFQSDVRASLDSRSRDRLFGVDRRMGRLRSAPDYEQVKRDVEMLEGRIRARVEH